MRELALYVNYTREHGFVAPHDMNWRDEAVQAIEQARRAIEYFEESLPTNANVLRGELTDLQREQLMRRVRERHAMVEDAVVQAEVEAGPSESRRAARLKPNSTMRTCVRGLGDRLARRRLSARRAAKERHARRSRRSTTRSAHPR